MPQDIPTTATELPAPNDLQMRHESVPHTTHNCESRLQEVSSNGWDNPTYAYGAACHDKKAIRRLAKCFCPYASSSYRQSVSHNRTNPTLKNWEREI